MMRLAAILVLTLTASSTAGQDATASLQRVEQATVNTDDADDLVERRVCLNPGSYVLAFQAHSIASDPARWFGFAGLVPPDTPPGPERIRRTVTVENIGGDDDAARWGWRSISVTAPDCYTLMVSNGRVRLYLLRVAVAW